jgi:hypothetical protein
MAGARAVPKAQRWVAWWAAKTDTSWAATTAGSTAAHSAASTVCSSAPLTVAQKARNWAVLSAAQWVDSRVQNLAAQKAGMKAHWLVGAMVCRSAAPMAAH